MNTSRKKAFGEIAKVCLAVIARSTCDEAIHSSLAAFAAPMDCFASLAMTAVGCGEIAKPCVVNSPPSTRPCAWRGGVGGGGRLSKLAARGTGMNSSFNVCRATPHPRPLPTASREEGSR